MLNITFLNFKSKMTLSTYGMLAILLIATVLPGRICVLAGEASFDDEAQLSISNVSIDNNHVCDSHEKHNYCIGHMPTFKSAKNESLYSSSREPLNLKLKLFSEFFTLALLPIQDYPARSFVLRSEHIHGSSIAPFLLRSTVLII